MASFSFLNLDKELKKFTTETLANREKALDEASDYLMEQLKNNTPVLTGKTRDSWERSSKYKGVRYINNTAVNKKDIPIINLLEFSSKGHPFARKTFDASLSQIQKIFENNLEKGE